MSRYMRHVGHFLAHAIAGRRKISWSTVKALEHFLPVDTPGRVTFGEVAFEPQGKNAVYDELY